MTGAMELRAESAVLIALVAVFGLIVGSFLNVVIHRLPRMLLRAWSNGAAEVHEDHYDRNGSPHLGLIGPRSRCPNCDRVLNLRQLVPVVSYLALGGRCAWCKWRIPLRYPAIELLGASLSALVAWRFGFGVAMAGALLLTWTLIALSAIDIETQLMPDLITLPLLWVGLAFNAWAIFAPTSSAVLGAIAGYLTLWTAYYGFRLLTGKEGMGGGDFKCLAMLGAWLGWQALPVIVILASAAGAFIGTGLLVLGRHRREAPLAFGPFLAAAGWLSLMWGEDIMQAYLGWAG